VFQCEPFVSSIKRVTLTQWDYRDAAGELHSGISHGSRETAECEAARFGHIPSNCPLTESQREVRTCNCVHN
jgi:hypothetical protein